MQGEVQALAHVEDPRSTTRKVRQVSIATLSNGNTIGDIELYQGRSTISLTYVAMTEVETYEITLDQWERQVWTNFHAKEIKGVLVGSIQHRVSFHSRRVSEEMAKVGKEQCVQRGGNRVLVGVGG